MKEFKTNIGTIVDSKEVLENLQRLYSGAVTNTFTYLINNTNPNLFRWVNDEIKEIDIWEDFI